MSDFLVTFFRVLAVLVFLYLNWRTLGDNYDEKKLVAANWLGLLAFVVGGRLVFGLLNWGVWNRSIFDWFAVFSKPGLIVGGGYVGFLLIMGMVSKVNGWKYWSVLEDSVNPWLWFLILWRVGEMKFVWTWVAEEILLILVLVACWVFAKRYRSFWWYKSGKKGFVFMMANLIFGLGYLLLSLVFGYDLSQVVLALTMVLQSGAGLFMLGEVFKKV